MNNDDIKFFDAMYHAVTALETALKYAPDAKTYHRVAILLQEFYATEEELAEKNNN